MREEISDKISTLMKTSLLKHPTKFGAKIFRRYHVITFYVLGHFLAAPCRLFPSTRPIPDHFTIASQVLAYSIATRLSWQSKIIV